MNVIFWKSHFLNAPGSDDKKFEYSWNLQKSTALVESFSENKKLSKFVHGEKSYSSSKLPTFRKILDVAGFSYSKSRILLQKLSWFEAKIQHFPEKYNIQHPFILFSFSFYAMMMDFGTRYLHRNSNIEKFKNLKKLSFFILTPSNVRIHWFALLRIWWKFTKFRHKSANCHKFILSQFLVFAHKISYTCFS